MASPFVKNQKNPLIIRNEEIILHSTENNTYKFGWGKTNNAF